jgi:hypothetical protein
MAQATFYRWRKNYGTPSKSELDTSSRNRL